MKTALILYALIAYEAAPSGDVHRYVEDYRLTADDCAAAMVERAPLFPGAVLGCVPEYDVFEGGDHGPF